MPHRCSESHNIKNLPLSAQAEPERAHGARPGWRRRRECGGGRRRRGQTGEGGRGGRGEREAQEQEQVAQEQEAQEQAHGRWRWSLAYN